jgi:hypothetical protein
VGPTGDNVFVGGRAIMGSITIGDNVRIGATPSSSTTPDDAVGS